MPFKDIEKRLEYSKQHYKTNKARYLERNAINKRKLKDFVNSIKESKPCADCLVKYPYYVMDFDHQFDKKGLIIEFINRNNRTELEKEISKCEVVCSNCHRIRTHKRNIVKNIIS